MLLWKLSDLVLYHLGDENKRSSLNTVDFSAEISYQTDFDSSSSEIFPIEEKFEEFRAKDYLLDEPELITRITRIKNKIFIILYLYERLPTFSVFYLMNYF